MTTGVWTKHTVNAQTALDLPPMDHVGAADFRERRAMGALAEQLARALGLPQPHLWVWAAWGKLSAEQEALLRSSAGDVGPLKDAADLLLTSAC